MRYPDAQLRANHRPADLIPPGTHPGQVVVIQAAPASYGGRILLTLAVTAGTAVVLVVIAITFQMVAAAAAAAVPAVGGAGITVKLAKRAGK